MSNPAWTKPYCDISHLGNPSKAHATVTVCNEYGWSEATIFVNGSDQYFSGVASETFRDDGHEAKARAWAEDKLRLISPSRFQESI